ncbi:hypothetical protein F2Q69_00050055 [Brassica cretica]|uniref:Uncharacterized protein n=1 Tax=Brassica cretica TaxID=69181 RepID=A0A8S9PUP4_BRACR|nr:hypothetical protein F2Q69_00050055 [Brassica cretica]
MIHGSQEVKEEEAKHPNDEEEVEGIDLHQQRYPWEGSDMDYLYDELAFDLTKKKKKTFVVQDAIEDSAESHGRHTIRCLIVQEEFIGYIAEHPNDEEEVEGIDLHQQRYPWEESDMDYLYGESSLAKLLSMELTLEIDVAIFHVSNANASSNVDSQL